MNIKIFTIPITDDGTAQAEMRCIESCRNESLLVLNQNSVYWDGTWVQAG